MSYLTVIPTSVAAGSAATVKSVTAAAAIIAGDLLYKPTASTVDVADASDSAAKAKVVGIALNGGAVGQPIAFQISGQINLGATLVVGTTYVSDGTGNPGKIGPEADLGSGDFPTILGIAISTALLELNIQAGGIAKP